MSLGNTINCSSYLQTDNSTVDVTCTYDTTIYSGYSSCIQNNMELSPSKCVSSTESGSMLSIKGRVNGYHLVLVNPIWTSLLPMGILESPLIETYSLTGLPVASNPTTGKSGYSLLSVM